MSAKVYMRPEENAEGVLVEATANFCDGKGVHVSCPNADGYFTDTQAVSVAEGILRRVLVERNDNSGKQLIDAMMARLTAYWWGEMR